MADSNYQDEHLEDWHKQQEESKPNRSETPFKVLTDLELAIFGSGIKGPKDAEAIAYYRLQKDYRSIGFIPGWYFWDETAKEHGPYLTREKAQEALDDYVANL